jgi:2-succinyl-5-enolpyruvyl-6-hydroxy-3-cyclohexene-1-carboxylate synthase
MTRPRNSSPASLFAVALLSEFVRLGVHDVVLSPGSRSQALALAAAELEADGRIRLRVRIDERGAGFLALGLAVETRTPVLVITTSGTAVANLHPAVLEAHHSGVPLVVISADRPSELRGIGTNQTTRQPGIFGTAVRASFDVVAPTGVPGEAESAERLARAAVTAAGTSVLTPGPVHLNVAFSEPLSSVVDLPEAAPVQHYAAPRLRGDALPIYQAPGTVVVAGHGAGEVAEATARALGAPLLAEVSSGAHFGPNLVVAYRELLSTIEFGDRVERVIVFGHPTLSREVPAIIQRADVATIVVRSAAFDDYNPGHAVSTFADAVRVLGEPDDSRAGRAWLGRWVTTSRALLEQQDAPDVELAVSSEPSAQAAFSRQVLAGLRAPVTRRALVEAVWRMTWPHDRLVLGASRLIREPAIGVHSDLLARHDRHGHRNRAREPGGGREGGRSRGCHARAARRPHSAARRGFAALRYRRAAPPHPGGRRQRRRRNHLRLARGRGDGASGSARPRDAHGPERVDRAARRRLRLGVPTRREPRRARRRTDGIRRTDHRRGAARAVAGVPPVTAH